jgi:hypothetical protein
VALLQRRLAELVPAGTNVRAVACPFEAGPLVEAVWWHPMYEHDPEHRYLRDLLSRIAAEVTEHPPR